MKVLRIVPKAALLAIAAITFLTIGSGVVRAATQQESKVPESATLFLSGIGLTGAAGLARRKYNRNRSESLR